MYFNLQTSSRKLYLVFGWVAKDTKNRKVEYKKKTGENKKYIFYIRFN